MARGKWKRYEGFKNFSKTYKTYVKKYYAKARSIYKKLNPEASLKHLTNKEAAEAMFDDKLLGKKEFATYYRSYKRDLEESGSSADPTQYIVRDQAYKYSEAQYRAFTRAAKTDKFRFFGGMSREEFRTGAFRSEDFRRYLKEVYKQRKEELRREFEEAGREWIEEEVTAQAAKEMSLYFGSP